MFKVHRTRDGQHIPVAAMDDNHLINTIRLFFNKISEIKAAMAALDTAPTASTRFTSRLYNVKTINPEDAADAFRDAIEAATPYLLEAYLRGLKEPQQWLQDAFGRTTAIPRTFAALPDHVLEDDEGWQGVK